MIRLEEVSKLYDGVTAVNRLNLEVATGELCVLVGPSGCGKTTTLRMINRLIEPTSGRILIDGEDVTHVDPVQLRRSIGYVIQQGGLFPHRRVGDNVATVPRLLGWDRARTTARVGELLDLVGLPPAQFLRRYPQELSGGQRQRVGVARALAADPPILLMDEPFGAVDPITRDRLQQEFLSLQATLRKTIVFVTHDVDEAIRLGDQIAVLRQGGVLEQVDSPASLLAHPASRFVSDFVGADRALRRLAVTPVERSHLSQPVVVRPADRLSAAGAAMAAAGGTRAVVVDDGGAALGWVAADGSGAGRGTGSGDRSVADDMRPFGASIPLGTPLEAALSAMLQNDVGWVAVEDGGRYLGVLTPADLHATLRASADGRDAPA